MQLNLFQQDKSSSINSKIRADKCDAILSLYQKSHSYFKSIEYAVGKLGVSENSFEQNFILLCSDLFNKNEINYIRTEIKNSLYSKNILKTGFEDPKEDYYLSLVNYLQKGQVTKKQLGAFYTPKDVTNNLIDSCVRLWKFTTKDLSTRRLLDPTMGGGDWLVSWFEKTLQTNSPVNEKNKIKIFADTIHGIDIDPVSVLCTRVIFWDYFDYSTVSVKSLMSNLVLGDALNVFTTSSNKKNNLFDIVLGNPPYVVTNLTDIKCKSNDTNNLYAAITEASSELLKPGGKICFVVPLSLTCSKSLESLREYIDFNYSKVYYSTYGIRPQKMFPNVDQRITVFIGVKKNGNEKSEYFSSYGHFQWKKREDLVSALKGLDKNYQEVSRFGSREAWPKVSHEVETQILKKIKPSGNELSFLDFVSKQVTEYPVYYYGNARYFIKALDYVPYYKNSADSKKINSELKIFYAKDASSQKAIISLMNSTLFYWMWVLYSDCFHVDYKILANFKASNDIFLLEKEASKVVAAMKKNSFKKKHGENIITEFNIRGLLKEISSVDMVIANHFKLNAAEKKFSLNFLSDLRSDNSDTQFDSVEAA